MPLYIAITGDGFVFDETRGEDREAVGVTGDTSDKDERPHSPAWRTRV